MGEDYADHETASHRADLARLLPAGTFRLQVDLRTAAFIEAINKIAICYQDLGIFP